MPRTTSFRLIAVVALLGCSKAEPRKPDPDPPPPPTPVPTPAPNTVGRKLLVEGHARTEATAHYLAIEVPADLSTARTLDDLGDRPALTTPSGTYFNTVTAHDRDRWVHAIEGNKVVIGVMTSLSGGKPSYQLPVPVTPASLHLAGDALYIGSKGGVGWIDLAAAKPTYVALVKRTGFDGKAYDRFVREGNRLLAVDDEVMPMYADWFEIDPSGRPGKRLGDWKLPGVINGHYDHAALAHAGDRWTLLLIAPYGVLSGDGHDLAALPIVNDKLVFDPDLIIQNEDGKTPIVEEHIPSRTNGKPTTLGAAAFTDWSGMAVTRNGQKIVVAAGSRGLMVLPTSFPPGTKTATFLQPIAGGSSVLDVIEHAGVIHVLAETRLPAAAPQPQTHLLTFDADATKVIGDQVLGARTYQRFVR